jgi:hypothetical protein
MLAGCSQVSPNHQVILSAKKTAKPENQQQIDSIKSIAKEGDIIFRGGTDIESNIIRDFSYKDKRFSHCGIILKTVNGLEVSHILGGTTHPDGSILSEPIEDFLSYPENESAAIFGTDLTIGEINSVSCFLDSLRKAKVTFDLRFNLFTKQQLYCTEMLIDALRFAKSNVRLFPATSFNLRNTKYFFLANKRDEFLFYPIDEFQHNHALRKKGILFFPNYRRDRFNQY